MQIRQHDPRPVRPDVHERFAKIKAKADADIERIRRAYLKAKPEDQAVQWRDEEDV